MTRNSKIESTIAATLARLWGERRFERCEAAVGGGGSVMWVSAPFLRRIDSTAPFRGPGGPEVLRWTDDDEGGHHATIVAVFVRARPTTASQWVIRSAFGWVAAIARELAAEMVVSQEIAPEEVDVVAAMWLEHAIAGGAAERIAKDLHPDELVALMEEGRHG